MLPERALLLIREYSKPLTRPDWRTLHKMTNYKLSNIITTVDKVDLVMIIQTNMKTSLWYELFSFTQVWGLDNTAECHHISVKELLQMDGMREASLINSNRMDLIRMKRLYGFI
jgi:hypothetical protein